MLYKLTRAAAARLRADFSADRLLDADLEYSDGGKT